MNDVPAIECRGLRKQFAEGAVIRDLLLRHAVTGQLRRIHTDTCVAPPTNQARIVRSVRGVGPFLEDPPEGARAVLTGKRGHGLRSAKRARMNRERGMHPSETQVLSKIALQRVQDTEESARVLALQVAEHDECDRSRSLTPNRRVARQGQQRRLVAMPGEAEFAAARALGEARRGDSSVCRRWR